MGFVAAPIGGRAPGPVLEFPAEPVGIGTLDCARTAPADPRTIAAAMIDMLKLFSLMMALP